MRYNIHFFPNNSNQHCMSLKLIQIYFVQRFWQMKIFLKKHGLILVFLQDRLQKQSIHKLRTNPLHRALLLLIRPKVAGMKKQLRLQTLTRCSLYDAQNYPRFLTPGSGVFYHRITQMIASSVHLGTLDTKKIQKKLSISWNQIRFFQLLANKLT